MKKSNNISLDELVNQITSSVDSSWDDLKKIRFVYLELGTYLEKNTDFFMSVEKKVTKKFQLSKDEINDIYSDDLEDGSRTNWNKVICRSAAIILSRCLNELGIENKIISTTNAAYFGEDEDAVEIRHVFVNAKINENESIFLTLAADLPYIQNGMETQCFGNLISYKKKDEDGEDIIMYEGDEITDAVAVDKDALRQIDCDLGYLDVFVDDHEEKYVYTDYYFDALRKMMGKNKLYTDLMAEETDFYNIAIPEDPYEFGYEGALAISDQILGICEYISDYLGYDCEITQPFIYEEWRDGILEYANELDNSDTELDINCSATEFVKMTDNLLDTLYDAASMMLADDHNVNKITGIRNKMNNVTRFIAQQFIPKRLLPDYDNKGLVSQDYIANKLKVVFSYIFGCNEERREFNNLSYNEQIAIIRNVLPIIFYDIKDKNCLNVKRSMCLPCIYNIIRTYTLKIVSDDTYRIIFEIDNSGDPIYFSYNPTSNKFKMITQTRFYFFAVNNIVCSRDLKDKLNIEEVEDRTSPHLK